MKRALYPRDPNIPLADIICPSALSLLLGHKPAGHRTSRQTTYVRASWTVSHTPSNSQLEYIIIGALSRSGY